MKNDEDLNDITVTISGKIKSRGFGQDTVSRQEFTVSTARGHGLIMEMFSASLRTVMDHAQQEEFARDATKSIEAAVNAKPVYEKPEDPER